MRVSVARRNAALNNCFDVLNNGFIRIYSGTRPTDADTALSGNTLLAQLTFGSTAFAAATAGTKTANAITQDTAADATGTATFARLFQSDGTTAVSDISVGTSGAELNLNTVSLVAGVAVEVTSCVMSFAVGA
jgi:hypothetical protein